MKIEFEGNKYYIAEQVNDLIWSADVGTIFEVEILEEDKVHVKIY